MYLSMTKLSIINIIVEPLCVCGIYDQSCWGCSKLNGDEASLKMIISSWPHPIRCSNLHEEVLGCFPMGQIRQVRELQERYDLDARVDIFEHSWSDCAEFAHVTFCADRWGVHC